MVVFWFFTARSLAEAYLCTSSPRGHSTVGVPKRCEGFVPIWLRAREEFVDNHFQSINQSINQHHGLSLMQEVAAIYSEKLMPSVSS